MVVMNPMVESVKNHLKQTKSLGEFDIHTKHPKTVCTISFQKLPSVKKNNRPHELSSRLVEDFLCFIQGGAEIL